MTRAYAIYCLMFAAFFAGMWIILTLGAAARAPEDMSGKWSVLWDGEAPNGAGEMMYVQQSGRFWTVQLGQQKPMSMVLEEDWRGAREGRTLKMRLRGKTWTMDLNGEIPLKKRAQVVEVRMQLSGPSHHAAVARRIVETHALGANDPAGNNSVETAHAR